MRAGLLRERITIQRNDAVADGQGGRGPANWVALVSNLPARVQAMRADETLQVQAVNAITAYVVTIRYLSTVVPKMRVVWGSRTLEIHGVRPGERRDDMLLDCGEVS